MNQTAPPLSRAPVPPMDPNNNPVIVIPSHRRGQHVLAPYTMARPSTHNPVARILKPQPGMYAVAAIHGQEVLYRFEKEMPPSYPVGDVGVGGNMFHDIGDAGTVKPGSHKMLYNGRRGFLVQITDVIAGIQPARPVVAEATVAPWNVPGGRPPLERTVSYYRLDMNKDQHPDVAWPSRPPGLKTPPPRHLVPPRGNDPRQYAQAPAAPVAHALARKPVLQAKVAHRRYVHRKKHQAVSRTEQLEALAADAARMINEVEEMQVHLLNGPEEVLNSITDKLNNPHAAKKGEQGMPKLENRYPLPQPGYGVRDGRPADAAAPPAGFVPLQPRVVQPRRPITHTVSSAAELLPAASLDGSSLASYQSSDIDLYDDESFNYFNHREAVDPNLPPFPKLEAVVPNVEESGPQAKSESTADVIKTGLRHRIMNRMLKFGRRGA